jgi:hypothetical protein
MPISMTEATELRRQAYERIATMPVGERVAARREVDETIDKNIDVNTMSRQELILMGLKRSNPARRAR